MNNITETTSLKLETKLVTGELFTIKGMFSIIDYAGNYFIFLGFVNTNFQSPNFIRVFISDEYKGKSELKGNSLFVSRDLFKPTKIKQELSDKLRAISLRERKKYDLKNNIEKAKNNVEKLEKENEEELANIKKEYTNDDIFKQMSLEDFAKVLQEEKSENQKYLGKKSEFYVKNNTLNLRYILPVIYVTDLDLSGTKFKLLDYDESYGLKTSLRSKKSISEDIVTVFKNSSYLDGVKKLFKFLEDNKEQFSYSFDFISNGLVYITLNLEFKKVSKTLKYYQNILKLENYLFNLELFE